MREAQEISSSPSPDYTATPLESDLFEWHFTLRGPPNSAFAGGVYHGRIVLPATYPLRPPMFRFVTPSGRFETNREICLSISGHHEETWQPAWGVRTALVALRSFMETDPRGQLGGLDAPDEVRRRLAKESKAFRCHACGGRSNEDIIVAAAEAARRHEQENGAHTDVEIPSDLKMGWRDEMEKAGRANTTSSDPGKAASSGAPAQDLDAEAAELAEGFVATSPLGPPAARPAIPPTPTVSLAASAMTHQVQAVRVSSQDVPAWIDRLIMVLVGALAVMILKVLLL